MSFWHKKKLKEMNNGNQIINNFIEKTVEIPGWLAPEAAYFTAHLLSYQNDIGLTGDTVEIGVYCGKYLAILYQYLNPIGDDRVLGIDAFIGAENTEYPRKNVFNNILKTCGKNQRLDVIVRNSLDLTPETLSQLIQARTAKFVSIDGGHTADVVFHDLYLSTAILKNGGIIAMDDIFNHSLPGVTQGLFEFILKGNGETLAPFAHCYNKLFLTTPDHYAEYYRKSFEILEEMKGYDTYQRTTVRIKEDQIANFVPQLFGYEVLCFL